MIGLLGVGLLALGRVDTRDGIRRGAVNDTLRRFSFLCDQIPDRPRGLGTLDEQILELIVVI